MRASVALLLLAITASSQAEVYRCTDGGRTTFSDRPCHSGDRALELTPPTGDFDPALARQATERAQHQQAEVKRIEAEREQLRLKRAAELEREQTARQARCEEIGRNRAQAQRGSGKRTKSGAEARSGSEELRYWSERDFFECSRS